MRETDFHAAIADADGPLPEPRFAVYRNNVAAALVNAIRVRYPMTAKALSGAFVPLTARYVAMNRPASAVLIDYGAGYPDALDEPWMADVARLESAWWQSYHAAEAKPLTPQAITAQGAEALMDARLMFHPSLHILATATPAASNWQALIDGTPTTTHAMAQHILVLRAEADVTVRVVPTDTARFLSALKDGAPLGQAIEAAGADFDLQGQLAHLLSGQFICGVHS